MAVMQEIETKLNKGISVSSNEEIYIALLNLVKEKAQAKTVSYEGGQEGKKKLY